MSPRGEEPRLPFEARGASSEMCFGVGVYSLVSPRHAADLTTVRASLATLLARCIELGGRPYLYGWHEMTESQQEAVYGGSIEELAALRALTDPDHVLVQRGPSPGVRVAPVELTAAVR